MKIIAVKQRDEDPCTYDIIYEGSDCKLYTFVTDDVKLLCELSSGISLVKSVPDGMTTQEFMEKTGIRHFGNPKKGKAIGFTGPSQDRIWMN